MTGCGKMTNSVQQSIAWIEQHDHRLDVLTRMDPLYIVGDLFYEFHNLRHQYDLAYDHLVEQANAGNEMADEWLEQYNG